MSKPSQISNPDISISNRPHSFVVGSSSTELVPELLLEVVVEVFLRTFKADPSALALNLQSREK